MLSTKRSASRAVTSTGSHVYVQTSVCCFGVELFWALCLCWFLATTLIWTRTRSGKRGASGLSTTSSTTRSWKGLYSWRVAQSGQHRAILVLLVFMSVQFIDCQLENFVFKWRITSDIKVHPPFKQTLEPLNYCSFQQMTAEADPEVSWSCAFSVTPTASWAVMDAIVSTTSWTWSWMMMRRRWMASLRTGKTHYPVAFLYWQH